MKAKSKTANGQPSLLVDSEVVRNIRQHARSSMAAEICGVLIGHDKDQHVEVSAIIQGENAEQAGAHVTFTQNTWEHIYAVKDKKFPNMRIVGWYHSHPGFGIFLSEHDTFIHKNFFSSPGQVAWVFDPQSDEEGCFGWVKGRIERLTQIAVQDRRGGEVAESSSKPNESNGRKLVADTRTEWTEEPENGLVRVTSSETKNAGDDGSISLEQLVAKVFFSLSLLILGGLISWYFLPRPVLVPVLIDPTTGKLIDVQTGDVVGQLQSKGGTNDATLPAKVNQDSGTDAAHKKGNDAKSK
jgi:proteasome lid subunit RPN8/RPN11